MAAETSERAVRWVSVYWRILLYAAIIVGCVLLAPDRQTPFIYTEF